MGQASPSCCRNGFVTDEISDEIRGKGQGKEAEEVRREIENAVEVDRRKKALEDPEVPKADHDEGPVIPPSLSRQFSPEKPETTGWRHSTLEEPEGPSSDTYNPQAGGWRHSTLTDTSPSTPGEHHKGTGWRHSTLTETPASIPENPQASMGVSPTTKKKQVQMMEQGSSVEVREETPPDRPSDAPKQMRRHLTLQAAGHGGANILKDWRCNDDGVPRYIVKVYDETEAGNYETLQANKDPLSRFTPHYDGEMEEEDLDEFNNRGGDEGDAAKVPEPQKYMRLSNLLLQFQRGPHVMDCKLGIRSFAESEVVSKKLRPDLYERLKALSPGDLTPEEHEAAAITKHRWMVFNDNFTSLASLGFRVDGICHSGPDGEVPKKELKALRVTSDVVQCVISNFLPVARVPEEERYRADAAELILGQLQDLRTTMEDSKFVQLHSLVGASLLFVADAHGPKGDVFLIDFAKTKKVPDGITVDHLSPWREGNHEDGILLGVDNLIKVWAEVLAVVRKKESTPSPTKRLAWPGIRRLWR